MLKSTNPAFDDDQPWLSLITVGAMVFLGLFIFQFVGLLVVLPFFNFNMFDALNILEDPESNPNSRTALYLMQAVYSVGTFIFTPWLFIRFREKYKARQLVFAQQNSLPLYVMVLAGVISFFYVNVYFIEWNENIRFPEALKGLEQSARQLEENARNLTEFLTRFDSFGKFLVALIVIAAIPAVGEELLFRGIVQSKVHRITGSVHAAVWISAFLFSAFHLQFYGFVPRMLLGALFGYMYVWSGNLLIPMFAHFVNNGVTVLMLYLYNSGVIKYNIEDTQSIPVTTVLIFTVITSFILYTFYKKAKAEAVLEEKQYE